MSRWRTNYDFQLSLMTLKANSKGKEALGKHIIDFLIPGAPANVRNTNGFWSHGAIVSEAILTQEINRAGQLNIKVVNAGEFGSILLNSDAFIEVKSPYIKDGYMEREIEQSWPGGATALSQTWRGIPASFTSDEGTIAIVYDGELSLLNRVVLQPQISSSSLSPMLYALNLVDKYNEAIDLTAAGFAGYGFKFRHADPGSGSSIKGYNGGGAVRQRQNSSITTIWDELYNKTTGIHNNQISVVSNTDYTQSQNANRNSPTRTIYYRRFSETVQETIYEDEIISIKVINNISSKPGKIYVYGHKQDESAEGDISRDYVVSSYQGDWKAEGIIGLSETFDVYDDISETATLIDKGNLLVQQGLIDANGLQLTLDPIVGLRMWLGGLYRIKHDGFGVDMLFRLVKRTINLLDPARNTYTFGVVHTLSSALKTNSQTGVASGGAKIDDTAGSGDTSKTWSADKLSTLLPAYSDRIAITTGSSDIVLYRNNSYRIGAFIMLNLVLRIKATVSNGATLFTLPNANIHATQEVPLVSGSDRTVFMGAAKPGDTVIANGSILGSSAGIYYFVNGMVYAPDGSS